MVGKNIISKIFTILILIIGIAILNKIGLSALADRVYDDIKVSSYEYELTVNDKEAINITAKKSSDTNFSYYITKDCDFSSSNDSVAYIKKGSFVSHMCEAHICAVGPGIAYITVTYNDLQETIVVRVQDNRSTIERILPFGGPHLIMTPSFSKDIMEYNLVIFKDCNVIPEVRIKRKDIYGTIAYAGSNPNITLYVEADYNPIIEVIEADSILGTTEIKVTAADGSTSNTYKIHNIYEKSMDPRFMLGNIMFSETQTELNAAVYAYDISSSFEPNTITLILAKYDGYNRLKDIKKCQEELAYFGSEWIQTPSMTLEDGGYYKAFVWEDINNIKLLTEPEYYYNN